MSKLEAAPVLPCGSSKPTGSNVDPVEVVDVELVALVVHNAERLDSTSTFRTRGTGLVLLGHWQRGHRLVRPSAANHLETPEDLKGNGRIPVIWFRYAECHSRCC